MNNFQGDLSDISARKISLVCGTKHSASYNSVRVLHEIVCIFFGERGLETEQYPHPLILAL